MLYRPFGKTGLKVSVLGFGAAHVGSDQVDDAQAEAVLHGVLDEGITLIDTARGYGNSEERIGRFLAHRRDDFILSTKGGYGVDGVQDWTAECITKGIDQALDRLRTDRIDIFTLHSCERWVLERGEVTAALVAAKEAGKIRCTAYSGENEHRRYAIDCGIFDVIQTSINICEQRVLAEDLPLMAEKGIGVIAKRPLANVFWRFADYPEGEYCAPYWERAKAMELTPPQGMSWLEFALRFVAHEPGVGSIIAGTANFDHLRENVRLLEKGALDAETITELKDRFRRHDRDWVGQV